MLERLYHIHNDDGSTTGLNLHLLKPAKSKDGDDWYCTYQVASEFGTLKKKAFGIDGLHSYQVAITNIKLYIDNTIGSKKITWAGGEGAQLN